MSKTIFVIGAGAHVDYGMPTGETLKKHITYLAHPEAADNFNDFAFSSVEVKSQKKQIIQILQEMYYENFKWKHNQGGSILIIPEHLKKELDHVPVNSNLKSNDHLQKKDKFKKLLKTFIENEILSFSEKLQNTFCSIDAFMGIDHSKEILNFTLIGQTIIYYLINCYESYTYEISGKLNRIPLNLRGNHWIDKLLQKYLNDEYKGFFNNPPRIITFNYDCILEKKIALFLRDKHKVDDDEIKNLLKKIQIKHIYGSIESTFKSKIVNHVLDGTQKFQFKPANVFDEIQGIKVINRSNLDIKIDGFDPMKYKELVFLGYGFDKDNNSILMKNFNDVIYNVTTTKINMTNLVATRFEKFISENSYRSSFTEKLNCTDLLQNLDIIN